MFVTSWKVLKRRLYNRLIYYFLPRKECFLQLCFFCKKCVLKSSLNGVTLILPVDISIEQLLPNICLLVIEEVISHTYKEKYIIFNINL